jgi:glycosyltransferase involved in cell wall biosynthesis
MTPKASRPLLTIITSTFRAAAELKISANHLIPQADEKMEWVVIDGGAKDGTVEFLQSIEGPQIRWMSESDQGIYDAWNKGLALARGEWICFLGAGDFVLDLPLMLAAIRIATAQSWRERLIYGRLRLCNERGEALYELGSDWPHIRDVMPQVMCLPHPCVLHHRSLFEQQGTFDPSYRIAGDYEFLLRALRHTQARFCPGAPWVAMHLGGISTSARHSLLQLREVRRAQIQNGYIKASTRWHLAMARVYLRLTLFAIFPQTAANRLLDWGRRLIGKPPHWTRS